MKKVDIKGTFVCAALCATAISAAAQEQRPNILWLTYEDTSPEFIGCYGNEMAKTSAIDMLASEGVRFNNAFSTGTVSSASRFALITGCKPGKYGTGNHRSLYKIPDFVRGFPEYLREVGYHTSNNYKTDYNHEGHREMALKSWDEWSGKASWRSRAEGQPFFAVYNSPYSHQSKTMTNPFEVYEQQILKWLKAENTLAEDANFEMPPFFYDSPRMRREVSRIYNSIALTDQDMGRVLKQLEDDGLRDSTIIFCFADHGEGMPRAKGSAMASGYKVPFILYVPEMYAHLTPFGSGVVTEELVSFEDMSATVLALAGVELPHYHEGVPFLGAEKMEERAEQKPYVYGQCDRIGENVETARSITDGEYIYTRVFTPFHPFVRWMNYYDHADIQKFMRADLEAGVLNECQTEILCRREMEYLYNLKEDKWEVNNLANSKSHKQVMERMRSALFAHLIESKDANFIPEYTLLDYHGKQTPYELRLDEQIYPVEQVIEMASLCGEGKKAIGKQLKGIQSQNGAIAYWAALGLLAQEDLSKRDVKKLSEVLPAISYPLAKVWAAGALLNVEEDEVARKIIMDALHCDDDRLTTAALDVLVELPIDMAKTFVSTFDDIQSKSIKRWDVLSLLEVLRLRLLGIEFRHAHFW